MDDLKKEDYRRAIRIKIETVKVLDRKSYIDVVESRFGSGQLPGCSILSTLKARQRWYMSQNI